MRSVSVSPLTSPVESRVEAVVSLPDGTEKTLYVEADVPLVRHATPWLPAGLPVAMAVGDRLVIDGPVDAEAVANAARAQQVLSGWYGDLTPVTLDVGKHADTAPPASGVACFFSGGVDSFYSALVHADRITHLVFVLGFDIPLSNTHLADLALREARRAAAALGKPLIVVTTNLRAISDYRVDWQTQYHGAGIATVAHALGDVAGEFLVPGSFSEGDLHPWGTHPELDPHWSGSRVRLVHDAVDVTRPTKVQALADHQVALDHLRVCFKNVEGAYNCGECEKCVRTMINLEVAGALGRCRTLPHQLDLARVRRLRIDSRSADIFVAENLAAIARTPDPAAYDDLARALRHARRVGRVRRPVLATAWWGWRRILRPIRTRIRGH